MQASATSRWMVVNSNDSACTACDSPDSASASKPSTSILMKAGTPCLSISASSVVTGTSIGLAPALGFPAGRVVRGFNESRRDRRHRRIVGIDQHARPARLAPDRHRFDRDGFAAAVEQPERLDHGGLRLDRDDARAQPAERGDAIADMGADVEHQIAGPDEAAIEPVHRRGPRACRRSRCEATGWCRARS